MMYYCQL